MKGFCEISDILVTRFRDELREKALGDVLIRARVPVEFMQYVIVPEVAADMIMEDMGVDYEWALRIMEESWELGVFFFPDSGP